MGSRADDATASRGGLIVDVGPRTTIGGRYRVERRAWDSGTGAVWRAFDIVLERPVLIQTFPGIDPEALARAVARTTQINHPGVSQIYDMSANPPAIMFEHAAAGRLADRGEGALPLPQAASVVAQLAAAIAALHEHGIPHGAIGPGTVLFDEEGRPKLAGAGLRQELGESWAAPDEAYRPPETDAPAEERDRYALGAVAYRVFTGREAGPHAPPARNARRGIPPNVDALLSRALAHDPAARPKLDEFRRTLEPIASAEPQERGPGFFRQEARWLVPVLLVLGLAVAALAIGAQTGAFRFGIGREPASPAPSPTASTYEVASVEDFDPPPGNGQEHPAQASQVIDGKDTGWFTVGYSRTSLDGRKTGVGLLFDLGEARSVGRIEVRTSLPGWTAEWRVADTMGDRSDDYEPVTSFDARGTPVSIAPPRSARYWLLWITKLVDNESGSNIPYQAQVSEVLFLPR